MIAKAKSIAHTSQAISYGAKKHKAEELDRYLVTGTNPKDIAREFKIFQNLNDRCKKNTFSVVISPAIEDSKKLSSSDFRKITKEFITELGLENHPYISYLHKDKSHHHIHAYICRINENGKAKPDNFIGKKAQNAAEKIANKYNLISARQLQLENEESLKETIKNAHEQVLKQKPESINQYAEMMKQLNIILLLKYSNDLKLVGIRFKVGKNSLKGSAVDKKLSARNLEKSLYSYKKQKIQFKNKGLKL